MRRLSLALIPSLFLFGLPSFARAADADVENVITAQIDAFNHDDATKAESFASQGIKDMFPDPNAFLGMVKKGTAPLIHPRSTHFEAAVDSDAGTVQHVTVVDKDGAVWTAVYTLTKVDGHWAISGCVLVKSPETTALRGSPGEFEPARGWPHA